ncbi:MAG: hypothetical protein ABUR63_03410, partial [Verrucomicrobiota bacterium]
AGWFMQGWPGSKVTAAASGLALAAGLGWPRTSRAREWDPAGNVGIFVSFHFGGVRGGEIGLGFEGRAVMIGKAGSCGGNQQFYSGAVARIEFVDWAQTRLTLGPVVGFTSGAAGFAGEAAVGLARGRDGGLLAQVAADLDGLGLLNARLGYAFARDAHVGLGLHFPPLSTSGFCAIGRPLRRGDGCAPAMGAHVVVTPGHDLDQASVTRRQRAAREWLRRARLEWASVPAFCELADQLNACGAPAALVRRARDAAADELRHAILSADLAGTLCDAASVTLDPPTADGRPSISGHPGLSRLAVESWLDGCLGEGAAAEVARREAEAATNPAIKQTQLTIAADETRHADLAWDVLEWTLAVDKPAAAAALATRAIERHRASQRRVAGPLRHPRRQPSPIPSPRPPSPHPPLSKTTSLVHARLSQGLPPP